MRDRLGYGLRALLLVLPLAPNYRAAPPPDDPLVRTVRRLALRDRDAGIYPCDWPPEDKERWPVDSKTYAELMRAYEPARRPDKLTALPSWPEQILLLAGGAALAALGVRRSKLAISVSLVCGHALETFADGARRRGAIRSGVTPATAPRPAIPAQLPVYGVGVPAYLLHRLSRGGPGTRLPWTFWLASSIVSTINGRRAWNRAYTGASPW